MKSVEKNIIRYQIMAKHKQLTRGGNYHTARRLLEFLRKKRIALDLSDADYEADDILAYLGLRATYSRSFCTAYYKL